MATSENLAAAEEELVREASRHAASSWQAALVATLRLHERQQRAALERFVSRARAFRSRAVAFPRGY